MSQEPQAVPAEIAASAVAPNGMSSGTGTADEAATRLARLEAQFNELRSKKDREVAEERRARETAEAIASEAQQRAAWLEQQRIAALEASDPEQAQKIKAEQENYRRAQTDREVQMLRWRTWLQQQALEHGIPLAQLETARNAADVAAMVERHKAAKGAQDKEAEIEQRIMAKLQAQGAIQPKPKTPIDVGAGSAQGKVTREELDKAEQAFATAKGRKKADAMKHFQELSEKFASQG